MDLVKRPLIECDTTLNYVSNEVGGPFPDGATGWHTITVTAA
jgi:hypothetical protein